MKYHLVALFTIFVWGITFVSTKVLLVDLSPLWILLLRFVLGLCILCVIRPHVLRLKERTDEALFAAAGATGIAAYYLLENVALVFTTATAVGVIVAASPLFTALISAALGDRSSINIRFFCGFALAMAGLTVVGAGTMGESDLVNFTGFDLFGDMLALTAALVWAVYSTLVARIAQKGYETIAATKRTFVWGVAFILVTTLIFDPHAPRPSALLDGQNLLNLLFLGAVASAACFVTWGVAVKHLGATATTTYIYLVPAITATVSILILGEPLNAPIILGLAMTIAGLLLSQKRSANKRTQVARPMDRS